ncbi:wound-induced protein 1 [Argentina anserina]|uniref:wound-induced protein 1 n=1 Tax=Argentina anserina TaxID=57926 RepID=UPI0021762247|nr:wound-induced protein 1 [Potentilla anserina]
MRMLTGKNDASFEFKPQSICSVGPVVLVEGCDQVQEIFWVHAWTVKDGIITQVREYFNTSLTVTRLGNSAAKSAPSKFAKSASEITSYHCPSVWESSNRVGKSVPGLVLAI